MITDELREFIDSHLYLGAVALAGWKDGAHAIADRIDERIEREYVKLPVDADGKVIHVEDEVELLDGSNRFKAEWLEWDGEDWAVHETIGYGAYHEPSSLRHVQPDSWESIIGDARTCLMSDYKTEAMSTMRWKSELDELVERCKRLAGGV